MSALATTRATLVDVARILDPKGAIDKVANVLQEYNDILDDIPWVEGNLATGHQMTKQTSKPTPNFRLLNEGIVPAKATTGQYQETCAIMENRNQIDINVANLNGNTKAFRMSQDKPMIEAFSDTLAETLIYGDSSVDEEQFNGLATRYYDLTTCSVSANVIDAGGTGSDNTSIWLVCWGPGKVYGIYPKGQKAGLDYQDLGIQEVTTNATTGARMRAYESWMQWQCGLAVQDWRYVVRIANIDVSALLTAGDASDTSANILKLMIRALGKLPPHAGLNPVFYMNETVQTMLAVKLLDKSNMFLSMNEVKNSPVYRPNGVLSFQGVPCRRIDAILNTEAALV
jgi:hypothetical protein